jgi:hypothetical protein
VGSTAKASAPRRPVRERFVVTIFIGSFLLFLVQPLLLVHNSNRFLDLKLVVAPAAAPGPEGSAEELSSRRGRTFQ